MKHEIRRPYAAALLALVALLAACSRSEESSGSSATSATQQANSNTAQPPVAQGGTALAEGQAPLAVQTIPPPASAGGGAERASAKPRAAAATTPTASDARLPKLVAPDKRINFGKQAQDKTLVRAIIIRNSGRANLNIESVVPS